MALAFVALLVSGVGCHGGAGSGLPDDPAVLVAAARRADLAGQLSKSERIWRRIHGLARKRGDGDLRLRASIALSRLAVVRGRPLVGRAMIQQELASARAEKQQGRLALAQLALGDLLRGSGEPGRAVEEYRRAAEYAQVAGLRSVWARALSGRAGLEAVRGDLSQALEDLARVVALLGKLRGLDAARAALAAGRGFSRLGDPRRARRYLGAAQLEFQARGRLALSGDSALALVRLAVAAGRADLASRDLRLARRLFSQAKAWRRLARGAWLFSRALEAWGRPGEARKHRETARRLLRRLGDSYGEALLDLEAGRALQRRGRFRDSAARLRKAVRALEKAGDRFGSGEARILLGRARVQMGQAAEAVGELTRALDHAAALSAPELSWQAYALLGRLTDTLLDREDRAARFHKGAVNALERVQAGLDLLGGADAAAEENAYYELSRAYIKRWRRGGDPAHFDAALASLERSRSRRTLDLLTRAGASLADSPKDRSLVRAISGEERLLAEQLSEPGVGLALAQLLYGKLKRLRARRARIEGRALRYAAAHPAPVGVGILKGAISDKGAVLIYQVGLRSSLLMGFSSEGSKVVNLPARAVLERLVRRYTDGLVARPPLAPAELRRRGEVLVRSLLAPVSTLLAGRSRVHLVLSGPLWRLSFAALPEGGRGYMGDRRVFVRIPSPAVWLKVKATPRGADAKKDLLLVAQGARGMGSRGSMGRGSSPVRDGLLDMGHSLTPLARAPRRAVRIAAAVGSSRCRILSGVRATEAALRGLDLSRFRRLHFGARLVLPSRVLGPTQPALVLARGGDSDGLLMLREIMGLGLDADLVSMEGLDLGRGEPDWQGEAGLARALLLAGARSVVLPLSAGKPATADLFFRTLYRRLGRGEPKERAWLAAFRALRANGATPRALATYVLFGAL